MRSSRHLLLFGPLLTVLLSGCARMEPPPGGPEDKIRPYVSAVYPAPGSVNVPRRLDARIGFSEWVAKDVMRGQVWLSPPTAKPARVDYRGDLLIITSESPLDSATTYVLGMSGTVKDLVGLPVEAPIQLVFSTGPLLDSGILSGRMTSFPGAAPGVGAFAALYPADPALRARFSHLSDAGTKGRSRVDSAPNPYRERPAYVAPADSLGRFDLQGVRPGGYLLMGFKDADLDLTPDAVQEPVAAGPAVTVGTLEVPGPSLALTAMDTTANRLTEVRWVGEGKVLGRSLGSVRLRFAKPVHPVKALRRELYSVRRGTLDTARGRSAKDGAAQGAAGESGTVPVMDICLNPETGEVELLTAPLDPDSSYVVRCEGVPDLLGNPMDTSRDEAAFKVSLVDSAAIRAAAAAAAPGTVAPAGPVLPPDGPAKADSAAAAAAAAARAELPTPVFLGPRRISGLREKLTREGLIPSQGLTAYFPRILSDSMVRELSARLDVKSDTVPVGFSLVRLNFHEFSLRLGPVPLRGQSLNIGFRAPKSAAVPPGGSAAPGKPPVPKAPNTPNSPNAPAVPGKAQAPGAPAAMAALARQSFQLADSAKLGSLQFRQDASARGSLLVLRSLAAAVERVRPTPADRDEFTVDSLPEGWYAVDYFRDADRDSLWSPGRFRPWTPQEEFVHYADSVEVKPGGVSPGGPSGQRLSFPPVW